MYILTNYMCFNFVANYLLILISSFTSDIIIEVEIRLGESLLGLQFKINIYIHSINSIL